MEMQGEIQGRRLLTEVWRHLETSKSNPTSKDKRETKRYLAKDINCSEEIGSSMKLPESVISYVLPK